VERGRFAQLGLALQFGLEGRFSLLGTLVDAEILRFLGQQVFGQVQVLQVDVAVQDE